jgi:hypothetical protein
MILEPKVGMKLKLISNKLTEDIDNSVITKVEDNQIHYYNKNTGVKTWFHRDYFMDGSVVEIKTPNTLRGLME